MNICEMRFDALTLAQNWIKQPSISPDDGEILKHIRMLLLDLDFTVELFEFEGVKNLYAYNTQVFSKKYAHMCFVGHVDVVPPGSEHLWSANPFSGVLENGFLFGRGSVDMKSAIAAFISALSSLNEDDLPGVSILLTSDEESDAINGVKRMVEIIALKDLIPNFFLIGEPTGVKAFGDCIKVGRRGSVTAEVESLGKQGHIAYPHLFENPINKLLRFLNFVSSYKFDNGTDIFEPSRLEITSFDVGNSISNIVPASARARFGIRYNTLHTGIGIKSWLEEAATNYLDRHRLEITLHGEAFVCHEQSIIDFVSAVIKNVCGSWPLISTSGGTSDGRFLSKLAPVLEFGASEATMHQINECISIVELNKLSQIYELILKRLINF